MFELTPDLQAKFDKFRDSYEWALVWMADSGGNAERKERNAIESALRDIPLAEIEQEMFLRLLREEASVPNSAIEPKRSERIPPPAESESDELVVPPPIPKPE